MSTPAAPTGPTRWIRPFLVVIAALAAGLLLVAPMAAMEPRDLPIAVVNLDEGIETPQGAVDAGDAVVETVTADDSDGLIAWQALDSQDELDDALEDNEIYAALVVPADFSESQVLAQQGAGEASAVTLIINEGKHPMVTAQLSSSLGSLADGTDLTIETEAYHEIPDAVGLSATILPMVFMLLVYIASYAGGIVTRSAFPLDVSQTERSTAGARARRAAIQLVVAALAAVLAGLGAASALALLAPDVDFAFGAAVGFLALASFALMTLVIGSINWAGMAGMAVPIAILLLGLGTANLPYEFLPSFWQDWIHPWNPLRFLADGARALLYQDAGWWNASTLPLIITAVVGVVLVATSIATPRGRRAQTA